MIPALVVLLLGSLFLLWLITAKDRRRTHTTRPFGGRPKFGEDEEA